MKLSATTTAFLVLLAAFVVVGMYAQTRDLDTDVSTVNETLLPLTYSGEDLTHVRGLSLRYPRGWRVRGQDDNILLTTPRDADDPSVGGYTFTMTIQKLEGDQTLEPSDVLADLTQLSEGITPVEPSEGQLAAARLVLTSPDETVDFDQATRLTDDNMFLFTSGDAPIPQADWDDLKDDLFRILDSVSVAPDFRLVADPLTYALPDTWQASDSQPLFFQAQPAGDTTGQTLLQVVILSGEQLLTGYPTVLLPAGATLEGITDPMEIMNLYAESEDPALEKVEDVADVTYAGLEGKSAHLKAANLGEFRIVILDGKDGFYLLALALDQAGNYAAIAEDVEAILNSLGYTTPDPSFLPQQP
jgi:hypothetical protein